MASYSRIFRINVSLYFQQKCPIPVVFKRHVCFSYLWYFSSFLTDSFIFNRKYYRKKAASHRLSLNKLRHRYFYLLICSVLFDLEAQNDSRQSTLVNPSPPVSDGIILFFSGVLRNERVAPVPPPDLFLPSILPHHFILVGGSRMDLINCLL